MVGEYILSIRCRCGSTGAHAQPGVELGIRRIDGMVQKQMFILLTSHS